MPAQSSPPVRALVLSDLHAFRGDDTGTPSLLAVGAAGDRVATIFDSCGQALNDAGIDELDLMLCAGDITNQADDGALPVVWSHMVALADRFKARLVATAGNHDYDSRGSRGASPKQALLRLKPPFPSGDETDREGYFTWDVALIADGRYEVLSINSAANHGYVIDGRPEYEHGRFLPVTGERISALLGSRPNRAAVRLALTHHHPQALPILDPGDRSQMADAEILTGLLADDGAWLVVHGHKHRPYIHRAAGGSDAPWIFSAASFAADLGTGGVDWNNSVRNQFHYLELDTDEPHGLPVAVRFRSWTWSPGRWRVSNLDDGLPGYGGLGWSQSPGQVVKLVKDLVDAGGGVVNKSALLSAEPRLRYYAPTDWRKLTELLRSSSPGIEATFDQYGKFIDARERR